MESCNVVLLTKVKNMSFHQSISSQGVDTHMYTTLRMCPHMKNSTVADGMPNANKK